MSDPAELLRRKMVASHKALWDCQVTAPMVTVLNKVDRISESEAALKEELIRDLAPNPVKVSATSGIGHEELKECIYQRLQPLQEYQIRLPNTSEGLSQLSRLYETAELLQVSYGEELVVRLRGKGEAVARLKWSSPD